MDDGNPLRSNRKLLFTEGENVTGGYSGTHALYDSMSCINYATTYENNEVQNQLDAQLADEDQSNASEEQ